MKTIQAIHPWFKQHHKTPAIHIANKYDLPLCNCRDPIKIEKWKTVKKQPTCQLCKNAYKTNLKDLQFEKTCQSILNDLKKYINSKAPATEKLQNISNNLSSIIKQRCSIYSNKIKKRYCLKCDPENKGGWGAARRALHIGPII